MLTRLTPVIEQKASNNSNDNKPTTTDDDVQENVQGGETTTTSNESVNIKSMLKRKHTGEEEEGTRMKKSCQANDPMQTDEPAPHTEQQTSSALARAKNSKAICTGTTQA